MVDKRDSFDQIYLEMSVHRGSDVTFKTTKVKKSFILIFQPVGSASKKVCHLIDPQTGRAPLHRAFSLFVFNSENQLLLQQRSGEMTLSLCMLSFGYLIGPFHW